MRKTREPIVKEEAAEIFQSAIAYLQQAGLKLQAGNFDGWLVVRVEGMRVNLQDGKATFTIIPPVDSAQPEPARQEVVNS